ncbi:50S ribosomal protein L35 [Candidatus Falkowbacteria bacterium]|nr:50S ribosomal protein L35 [Candidatus Falkowbacteria bacterium]
MPKIKTHKATAKRIIITKTGKLKKRKAGQNHFNARESGKVGHQKRRDVSIAKSDQRTFRELMPYN